ncbi:hypothetical protein BsWGS_19047 [Bradybaena similaris]
MSNNNQQTDQPKIYESEPLYLFNFLVHQKNSISNTSVKKIEMDCNILAEIGVLKEDFADVFGIPAQQQKWHLKDEELNNEQTLWCYVDLIREAEIKVTEC